MISLVEKNKAEKELQNRMKQMQEIFENEKSSLIIENEGLQKRVDVSLFLLVLFC